MDAREIAQQAHVEFEIVMHAKESLRLALEAELIQSTEGFWVDRVTFVFDVVRRHLERMFKFKEAGGLLDESERSQPYLAPSLEKLRADHPRLREQMTRLKNEIQTVETADLKNLGRLRWGLSDFLSDLEDHIQEEIRIIHEIHWWDAGRRSQE